jgi:hypothetical protein
MSEASPDRQALSRLRAGEIVSGVGGALLLIGRGNRRRPLSVITAIAALALPYTQATRRAPALPVALSVVVTLLGAATTAGVLVRPSARSSSGLVGALAVAGGGVASLRQEDGADLAAFGELETIRL